MTRIAEKLRSQGYVLRSGGADGADLAFERGAGNKKQIFLPWKRFNGNESEFCNVPQKVIDFSLDFHPNGAHLRPGVQKIMGRNAQQVLGPDLDEPSKFLICWTPFETEAALELKNKIGGTGQAIRIARAHDIPIYNLREEETWERMERFVSE